MNRIARRQAVAGIALGAGLLAARPRRAWSAAASGWRKLWNGRDLDGWETFLRGPNKGDPALGVNTDPNGVFSVTRVDGAPVLRISGQDWGALTTKDEFESYHFRVEFRWGEKRWPPRETAKRDSGVLYHCVGPHGAGSGAWMQSFETQVQEGDCGDFHSVAGVIVDVEAVPEPSLPHTLLYKKGAPLVTGTGNRIIKAFDAEKPHGKWNLMEVVTVGQTAVHLVNGKPVLVLRGLRRRVDGQEQPLTRGRIQIQSEGAEVFYRRPEVRPIKAIPAALLK